MLKKIFAMKYLPYFKTLSISPRIGLEFIALKKPVYQKPTMGVCV